MRLKIWDTMKAKTRGSVADTRLPCLNIEIFNYAGPVRDVVSYELRLAAQVCVDAGRQSYRDSREEVARYFALELFGDLVAEIESTERWAFRQAYDQELISKLRRLSALARGEDVPPGDE